MYSYILFVQKSLRDDVTVKVHTPFRFEAVDLEQNLQQLDIWYYTKFSTKYGKRY